MPGMNFRQLSDFRALIENFGARWAAVRIAENPALLDKLNAILTRLTKAARRGDYPAFQEADHQMHEAIMEISGVPGLVAAWKIVWEKLAGFHRDNFDRGVPDARVFIEDHEYLVKMLATGDSVAAEDAMSNHIGAVWVRIMSQSLKEGAGYDPVYVAATYMKAYMQYPLRLKEVAERIAHTSGGNLSRLFRRRHNMGFQAWLQRQRMDKAAELLARSGLSVTAVAHRVGYHNLSRFSRHFHRHHGCLPRKWQLEKNPLFFMDQ